VARKYRRVPCRERLVELVERVARRWPCSAGLSVRVAGRARAREQAKLVYYIPTATDSVLCDYVLVMVGNKKTSRQVALDLEVGPMTCTAGLLISFVRAKRWGALAPLVAAMYRPDMAADCSGLALRGCRAGVLRIRRG